MSGKLQGAVVVLFLGVLCMFSDPDRLPSPPARRAGVVFGEQTPRELTELKAKLKELVARKIENGEYWSICVKELDTGDYLSVNDQPCEAASLIKLFAAGTALEHLEEMEENEENPGETRLLLEQMITVSDNQAYNDLVTRIGEGNPYIGFRKINDFAKKHGYEDTYAESFYATGDFMVEGPVGVNYTSAQDVLDMMEDVYRGELKHSALLLEYLKMQERTWKLPAGVPEGIVTANKTGEIADAEHDVCIVYTDTGDYIVSVMSDQLWSKEEAQYQIQDISAVTYAYLTGVEHQAEKNIVEILDN